MGKGDARRPTLVKDQYFEYTWCATFGHKWSHDYEWCLNCKRTAKEIADARRTRAEQV